MFKKNKFTCVAGAAAVLNRHSSCYIFDWWWWDPVCPMFTFLCVTLQDLFISKFSWILWWLLSLFDTVSSLSCTVEPLIFMGGGGDRDQRSPSVTLQGIELAPKKKASVSTNELTGKKTTTKSGEFANTGVSMHFDMRTWKHTSGRHNQVNN